MARTRGHLSWVTAGRGQGWRLWRLDLLEASTYWCAEARVEFDSLSDQKIQLDFLLN